MFRIGNIVISVLLWTGIVILTSCMMTDPSQWRPEQHMMMSRNCRIVCKPGQVLRYDSTDGSCDCQPSQPRPRK